MPSGYPYPPSEEDDGRVFNETLPSGSDEHEVHASPEDVKVEITQLEDKAAVAPYSGNWYSYMATAVSEKKAKAEKASPVYNLGEEVNTAEMDRSQDSDTITLRFNEDIKILLIGGPDWRLICWYLGVNAVRDVKVAKTEAITLIGWLHQQCLIEFMESKGYTFAGEINFDSNGNVIPCSKQTWILRGKEVIFTSSGYIFFDAGTGNKEDNVAFMCWTSGQNQTAGLQCYSHTIKKSKHLLEEIEQYTKSHNCLRGAKIRDVHVGTGTFTEVIPNAKYNWESYYFSKTIRDLFKLEVFGFLEHTKRYNALGIKKRGVLMYGQPGTGKTTIGHIICNYAKENTVIWITPDLIAENNNGKHSIKLLYMLADYVAPAVILLEDLDLFSEDRDSTQGNLGLGALMNILDGVNSVQNAVTIATTNRLELIEKALSNRPGRFDSVIEVPPLEAVLRKQMFNDRLTGCKVDPGVVDYLVQQSDGWTGAETQEFINRMNLYFINRHEDNNRVVTQQVVKDVLGMVEELCLSHKKSSKKKVGFY